MSIETPRYHLVLEDKPFEIRKYEPFITAEVQVSAEDYNEAANRGFSPLANFIFGNNIAKQKISMTSPVTAARDSQKIAMTSPVTVTGEKNYTVAFTMPRQFTMETLPEPLNKSISFKQHSARSMAVIRFSGQFNQRNFSRRIDQLRDWVKAHGYQAAGEPVIAGYDPPITPWFLKHNEVMIEVAK